MTTARKAFAGLVVIVVVIGGGWLLFGKGNAPAAEADVRNTVTAFGDQLQKVSLLAPDASTTLSSAYGPYVDPALMTAWQADLSTAPGRQTSSPWPDHIEIGSVTKTNDGTYLVNGTLVFMTSNEVEHGGNAGIAPVILTLKKEHGTWKITAYSQGTYAQGTPGPATASSTPPAQTPAAPPSEEATSTATSSAALSIATIAPSSGAVGTRVIMTGSGFTSTSQVVLNGGNAAISKVAVNEAGTVLTFTMPDSAGAYCAPKQACPLYLMLLKPGTYALAVRNTDGSTSNSVQFTLTGGTSPNP